VLAIREQPDVLPGPCEILIAVEAIGVNYRDIYERTGQRILRTPPFTAGIEGAGRVLVTGSEVTGLREGQRVAWASVPGSYAERVIAPAERVVAVPDGVDPAVAAAMTLQGLTAHYLSHDSYVIRPGDDILVHAAAGGVGGLLVQIAKARGATVIGTVSSPEKELIARAHGADVVIRYDLRDLPVEIERITGGQLVHCVYDGVGRSTVQDSLASLRPRGSLVLYGVASGPPPPIDIDDLARGSFHLTRPRLEHFIASPAELRSRAGDVFGWLAAGQVVPRISRSYPLSEAAEAQAALESRETTGKTILVVTSPNGAAPL
jgi:NADPH:quinone reductase